MTENSYSEASAVLAATVCHVRQGSRSTPARECPCFSEDPRPPPAHTGGTGEDDEDQGLPPLRPLHEQVPVWSEYAGAAAEKPEGL